MRIPPIQGSEFLKVAVAAHQAGGLDQLAAEVACRWNAASLCDLLINPEAEVRRMASMSLGLIGDRSVTKYLSVGLRDSDQRVTELTEDALWSIWFRSGSDEAQSHFHHGLRALNEEQPRHAAERFMRALRIDPTFAEACNQAGIAYYLLEEYPRAQELCLKTVELEPVHFGAFAGMGHCHAHRGEFAEAARYYRIALRINPRMYDLVDGLSCIEARVMPSPLERGRG